MDCGCADWFCTFKPVSVDEVPYPRGETYDGSSEPDTEQGPIPCCPIHGPHWAIARGTLRFTGGGLKAPVTKPLTRAH